ncbi:penicillin-binding protein 1B [Pseudidiomarina taiwanensis]|uniref:Penicillin-binding protein 1B n=1 Tax=Pseudidiomarina taiwanensis TaxID=337250 RepID=A0A432ZCD6_9GAMM|nr:penicillin-binding protein 1B [Pseudidiomarina taiwanensis]RUO75581.1 penicillin-binding protein 1B [Pseudidiomarina taiwanensis]
MSNRLKQALRYSFVTLVKVGLAAVVVLTFYLIYLDSALTSRFQIDRSAAPALVYGRSLTLQPGQTISVRELCRELELLRYQAVSAVKDSGQYRCDKQTVELYRRPFDFADGPEMAQRVVIEFSADMVSVINSLPDQRPLNRLRLEPPLIGRLSAQNNQDRLLVGLELVPNLLIETLLLVEDREFYHHAGISLTSIARAALANLAAMRTVQGGSTLTQQLVKNLYLTRERSLWRKANEALMALVLDFRFSKNEILEAYLNEVYFGQDRGHAIHGVGLASRFYFGKQVQELHSDEIALLVALIKGPSYYDPRRYPERALERRDLILQLMVAQGLISQTQYVNAVNQSLAINRDQRLISEQIPHYLELVKAELQQRTLGFARGHNGLRVFTYFDPWQQQAAEQALQQQLPQVSQDPELQGAVVVSDYRQAKLVAVVGDRERNRQGFNRAVAALRPIGSLIKPVIYGVAMDELGLELQSILDDSPLTVPLPEQQGSWQPENFDGQYRGSLLLYHALVQSRNIPAVRVGLAVGIDELIAALQRAGVNSPLEAYPALTLGAVSLAPITVNELYSSIANQGRHRPLQTIASITDHDGLTVYERQLGSGEKLFSPAAASLIDFGLRGVVNEGTGKVLAQAFGSNLIAGKSGTSNDFRDSWFSAYDGRYAITVWLGRDDNQPIFLSGSGGALAVVRAWFKAVGVDSQQMPARADLAIQTFHPLRGVRIPAACSNGVRLLAPPRPLPERQNCAGEQDEEPWWKRIF